MPDPEEREDGQEEEARQPKTRSRASRRASSPRSSPAGGPNPLGLEPATFEPGAEPHPPLDADLDEFEAPEPEPIVWSPERAGYILKGAGFLLHSADGASRKEGGDELWKMTESDLEAMGPPLANILNRYDAARRLAGLSDEGALAFGMLGYAKRNLATRGRILTEEREAEEAKEPPLWERPAEPPQDAWREGGPG